MPHSWNESTPRALSFARDWRGQTSTRHVHPFALLLLLLLAAPMRGRAAPGDLDNSFVPSPVGGAIQSTLSAAIQPDGKMMIGGSFATMSGITRSNIARISATGVLDAAFTPGTNDVVQSCAVQDDGKIILTGQFTAVNSAARTYIVRLLPDGTVDPGYSAYTSEEVRAAIPLPDGKVIYGGFFPSINGVAQRFLGRTNANGTHDASFAPTVSHRLRMVLRQPDGRLVIGGDFTSVNGITRNRLARINADGTLDANFNPDITGSGVYCAVLQPDGQLVIAGAFTAVGGTARTNVARIRSDGTLDTTYNTSSNGTVRGSCLQTDGKITFVGQFTQFGGVTKNRIARVLANGTLDATFAPTADALIFGATQQADGKILVMGQFSFFNAVSRPLLVRLENDPAGQFLTVPSPGRIQWLRSGSSPETNDVDFQLSTDSGTTWSPLGAGTRINGGWERTGLVLPAAGQVRARARTYSAYGNGSRSILQTIASFSLPAQQVWRQQYFGISSNTGLAADNADPDLDGAENLIEYTFGRHPLTPDAHLLPAWGINAGQHQLQFTLGTAVTGITCRAERSDSLQPGSWTQIPNQASPPNYLFSIPAFISPRTYLRLQVQPQ